VALRLDGYIRVSRIGGRKGEGYISPQVQQEAIETYAEELEGEIVAWHDDQDQSGGNVERPGFQRVLERLEAGETDGIVVMRVDRFARSVADGATIVRDIVERDQVFASVKERIDPRTAIGTYQLNDYLNNAERFLNESKEGWVTAKARAIARGAHIGPTPNGYERIPKGEERSGCLTPHPTYGPAMTKLFRRAATGKHGDTDLARWMTETAPRESGAPWQPSEIRRWLSNRVYLGEVRYGDLVNTEAHKPLTDPETWERCQRAPGVQRRGRGEFLLAGLVRCANCRYSMTGQSSGGSGNTPVYRCPGRNGRCDHRSVITGAILEDYLTSIVTERLLGLELEAADAGVDLAAADREYEAAETELQAFAGDIEARRILGEAGWHDHLTARALARDEKRTARDEAYSRGRLAAVAADVVDDLDHDGLRDLLRGMVRHVFVRRRARGADVAERVFIVWSDDPEPIEVPGPHRSGPFKPVRW
jgi:DNA invertase Pin-like site-specific DNA recombinase